MNIRNSKVSRDQSCSYCYKNYSVLCTYANDLYPNTSYYAGIMLDAFSYLLC